MAGLPVRLAIASAYRSLLYKLEKRIPLPDINPFYYDALAIVLSVVFLYAQTPSQKALLIGAVLLTDWLDGATARRYNRVQRSGYVIDIVTDRVSEAFIFSAELETAVGQMFFLLWMINCILTYYSVQSNKHVPLPLRFAYLVVLIA